MFQDETGFTMHPRLILSGPLFARQLAHGLVRKFVDYVTFINAFVLASRSRYAFRMLARWNTLIACSDLSLALPLEFTPFNGQKVKPVSDVIVQKPPVICNRATSGGVLGCKTLRDTQRSACELLRVFENVQRTHALS